MLILTLAPLLFSYLSFSSPGDWCTQWGFFGGVPSELITANWHWCMSYYADGYVWGYVIAYHRIFVLAASRPELLFPLCLIYFKISAEFSLPQWSLPWILTHFHYRLLQHQTIFLHNIHLNFNFTFILCHYMLNGSLSHWPISAMRSGEVWVLLPHEVWEPHTVHRMTN